MTPFDDSAAAHLPRLPASAGAGDSVTAEVLSPAEAARYRLRAQRPAPTPLPTPHGPLRLDLPNFDPFALSPEEREMVKAMARKGREALRAYRAHRRALRSGKSPKLAKGGVDIDAAIERAYARDLELARKTPERLWTEGMKRAVQRARDHHRASRARGAK